MESELLDMKYSQIIIFFFNLFFLVPAIDSYVFLYNVVMIGWLLDISYFQWCTVCQPHRSCQATPLLPADGVW